MPSNESTSYSEDVSAVYNQMDNVDKKKPLIIGPLAFFASAFLGLQFWFMLLPFTVLAVIGDLALVLLRGPRSSSNNSTPDDVDEKVIEILPSDRKYDVVLLGVTGFTGKLAACYLAEQYGAGRDAKVKWAVAGRSKSRVESTLKSIATKLGNDEVLNVDVMIVDTSKRDTVREMVKSTRTVITTAGPFVKYGSSVVELCAKYGTHYADITGEVDWNKDMMKLYESTAKQSGAKIVSFCGHDSIPWDLTVRVLSEKLKDAGDELTSVECLDELQGGVSGGTIATFFETLDLLFNQFSLDSIMSKMNQLDCYMRLPDGSESSNIVKDDLPFIISPCRNPSSRFVEKWAGPFVMAYINFEVVRRGVALSKHNNKHPIKYREAIVAVGFMDAFSMLIGLLLLGTLIVNPITRPFLKMIMAKPGEGPSEKEMEDGFLCVTGYGIGADGRKAESVMYFGRDGGYTSTARMLVESGLCLALDGTKHDYAEGGFYSPSSLMCHPLLDRLIDKGIAHFACCSK